MAGFVLVLAGPARAGTTEGDVHLLVIEGVINPFTERYLADGVRTAEKAGANAPAAGPDARPRVTGRPGS